VLGEFKAFVARGNVIDLAVAVIIGAAFATITTSLTGDIIMPVVGWISGGVDFSSWFIRLGDVPPGYRGSMINYEELKQAGVAMIGLGAFVTVLINFLILAFVIFVMVRQANKFIAKAEDEAAGGPSETDLLVEIRDELRRQNG